METRLTRAELDRLAQQYSLDAAASASVLELAGARPGRGEVLTFVERCLRYAGVLSLGASVVFFVAANWSDIAVFGRFALLEILLVVFVVLALLKPPPAFAGRAALLLAFFTTGALLALFGQTYQTGADVYELFLSWALLALPFAVAAQWGVASAAWVCVFDLALFLFCGWNPRGGILWAVFDSDRSSTTHALIVASALNLGGWFVFGKLAWRAVPEWVCRLILFIGLCFVSWLGFIGVMSGDEWRSEGEDWLALGSAFAALSLVVFTTVRERRDIFPLALAAGSFIFIASVGIARLMQSSDEGVFFMMALWLVVASTAGGRALMQIARHWRASRA